MQLTFLRALYDHMEWADALTWRTVLADDALSGEDFIVESLIHLHMVQHAWRAIWTGGEVWMPTRDDFDGLDAIRDWGRTFYPAVAEFLVTLTDERLDEVLEVPWTDFIEKEIGHPPEPSRLGDGVYQVAAHSLHHRAQINRRIREIGGAPGMVDYIGWVWRGRPEADW